MLEFENNLLRLERISPGLVYQLLNTAIDLIDRADVSFISGKELHLEYWNDIR